MVGEVGVAAAVICLAAVVGKGYGLLAAPVFFRRAEVARLMLRGGQHVGDLPGIGDVVVQAGLDDQVDGLLAGDPEPGGVLAVAVAHRSEEHTSELQSLMRISYAVFCLKKKNQQQQHINTYNYTAKKQ